MKNIQQRLETHKKEIAKQFGYTKNDLWPTLETPKYTVQMKTIKNYYGTVWIAYEVRKSGAIAYTMHGRWKDAKYMKEKGNKIKKIVLEDYKNE